MSEGTKNVLADFYNKYDSTFRYGINRKYLLRVYKKMGRFTKPEEKQFFLQKSQYYKKRNQKIAGVHLREFISVFSDIYHSEKKKNKDLNEREFLAKFMEEMDASLQYVWMRKIIFNIF